MGEEEQKAETAAAADAAQETETASPNADEKPGIADRLRKMGIMDRGERASSASTGRRMSYVIVAGAVVAVAVVWWLRSKDGVDESAATVAQAPAHAGPRGWPPPPPWAYPGAMPPPQGGEQSAWPPARPLMPPRPYGPPPSYYNNAPRYPGESAGRFGPPESAQGPASEAAPPQDPAQSAGTDRSPGWMSPPPQAPQPPAGPEWTRRPPPAAYGSPYGPGPQQFGPPQADRQMTPPGWPQEAWRARRPEEVWSRDQEWARQAPQQQPQTRWPEPPPDAWQSRPYGYYGPPPWGYRPIAARDSDMGNGNPWAQ